MPHKSDQHEHKNLLNQISEDFTGLGTGSKGALMGFVVALLICIFGFWKTIFVLIITFLGYFLGLFFYSRFGSFREFLDKLIPPGFFR